MTPAWHRKLAEVGDRPIAIRARQVFSGCGPVLENGTVEISGGRVTAVHDRPGPVDIDLGNTAVIPGLVNAHTHLELSDLAEPLQPAVPFTGWLNAVISHRRARIGTGAAPGRGAAGQANSSAVARGLAECCRHGTTTVGDIVGPEWSDPGPAGLGPRVVAFRECLTLASERIPSQMQVARDHVSTQPGATLRGISPHAPYSVHPELFHGLIDLGIASGVPLAMHLAETKEELELLARGTGPFVEFLSKLGAWRSDVLSPGSRPLDYLRELSRVRRALVVHGNYLAEDEIDFLAGHPGLSVVYCPRTHAFFGHPRHPWRRVIERGVNVALGTDSRASNPDLSLWNELLFLRRRAADFPPAELLALGTSAGARALGLEHETGALAPGLAADLAVVEFPPGSANDPYAALFHPHSRMIACACSGNWDFDES